MAVAKADDFSDSLSKWTGILPPDPKYTTLEKLEVDNNVKEFMTSLNQYCPLDIISNELTLESVERKGLTYRLNFRYSDYFPSMMALANVVEYIYSSITKSEFNSISLCIKDALYSHYNIELLIDENASNEQLNLLLKQDGSIININSYVPDDVLKTTTSIAILDENDNVESIVDYDGTILNYNNPANENEDPIYVAVEENAKFPGDKNGLYIWLSENVKYPEDAFQDNITGCVTVKFVIRKDSSVDDAVIVKGVCKSLDAEALRVVRSMPKWSPAKNNGVAVSSYFNLPITFNLSTP